MLVWSTLVRNNRRVPKRWKFVVVVVAFGFLSAVYATGNMSSIQQSWIVTAPTQSANNPVQPIPELSGLAKNPPLTRPSSCITPTPMKSNGAWIVDWMDNSGISDLVPEQAKKLGLLDFAWLGTDGAGRIVEHANSDQARSVDVILGVAQNANPCGWRFLTLMDDNSTPAVMAGILLDPKTQSRHIKAVAATMAAHPLAQGLTLDYEATLPNTRAELDAFAKLGGLHNLAADEMVDRISLGYKELVTGLAYSMKQQHRLLRVAVPTRTNDEIAFDNVSPYLFDYGDISKLVSQVIIMAYDFHWSTGDPGPVAPAADVKASWQFIKSYGGNNFALAIPAYGYDWTVNAKGLRQSQTKAKPFDAAAAAKIHRPKTLVGDGETRYDYTDSQGHRHIAWDAATGLKLKLSNARRLCNCGVMAWGIGNSDPFGSARVTDALK